MAPDIPLLFVDEHVVVANKPSGLLVHRGWGNDHDVAMFRVRDKLGAHVHPVHRLDRGTSGALVFARTREAAAVLGRSFEARLTQKRYLALVRGTPSENGTIDYPIPKSEDGPRVPALTRFRLLGRSPVERCSLVLALPETGRLHQVRRHLRHVSHPLIGDVKYGSGELNRYYRARYALHRLALHAASICFEHPTTGEVLTVTAPLPPELAGAFARLGLPEVTGTGNGEPAIQGQTLGAVVNDRAGTGQEPARSASKPPGSLISAGFDPPLAKSAVSSYVP